MQYFGEHILWHALKTCFSFKQQPPFTCVLQNSCSEICQLGQLKYLWWTPFLVAQEYFPQISLQPFANLPSYSASVKVSEK